MTNAKRLAKIANITEQQAVTMAVIVNSLMRGGLTMEQAVESYMKSAQQMIEYDRQDRGVR